MVTRGPPLTFLILVEEEVVELRVLAVLGFVTEVGDWGAAV